MVSSNEFRQFMHRVDSIARDFGKLVRIVEALNVNFAEYAKATFAVGSKGEPLPDLEQLRREIDEHLLTETEVLNQAFKEYEKQQNARPYDPETDVVRGEHTKGDF